MEMGVALNEMLEVWPPMPAFLATDCYCRMGEISIRTCSISGWSGQDLICGEYLVM